MDIFQNLESKYIQTKYGKVHYLTNNTSNIGNDKKILVLIHGLAASSKSWIKFVEYLPKNLILILPDLLGHGNSDTPNIDYHVLYQKEIVESILKIENISEYSLMGHSYGGWVASTLAINNQKIKKLILEDAGGLKDFFEVAVGTEKREQYKKDLLTKAIVLNANEHVLKSIIDDEFSSSQITKDDLQKIPAKTLILWGDEDTTIDKKFAYIFKNYIKNSEVVIIKNSKHTSHYSTPQETAKIVTDFLSSD